MDERDIEEPGRAPAEPDLGSDRDGSIADGSGDTAVGSGASGSGGDANATGGQAPGGTTEDPVAALIRLTTEHAAAAAAGSPDQPWLLKARKAASRSIQSGDYGLMARLSVTSAPHLAVVQADATELGEVEFSKERIARLMGDRSWNSAASPVRAAFADPAEFYIQAKRRFAAMSSRTQGAYGDAAELDAIAKRYAQGLVRGGRIIDVAMRSENMALTALADAGLTRDVANSLAVGARQGLARAYLDADQRILRALDAHNWTAYAAAADDRLKAMISIAGDPAAMVALGRLAAEQGNDIRAKAAADLTTIRISRDAEENERFQKHLKEFEASFLKDLTVEGSDPMRRWIRIQNEIERQERGATPTGPNLAYLRKLSEKTAHEVAVNPVDWARLQQTRPDLVQRLMNEGNKGRESVRSLGRESTIAERTDGGIALNEDASRRNAGESPEVVANQTGPATLDRQTQEIRAQQRAAGQERASAQNPVNPAPHPESSRAESKPADPAARNAPEPLCADPADRIGATAHAKPATAETRASRSMTREQKKAAQHSFKKHPEFNEDHGPYDCKPGRELGPYVNSRMPYDIKTLDGQLDDPRKKVFALPLNSFGSDRIWRIKKKLKGIAKSDPERFMSMYQATKVTWDSWQNAPGERTKVALDQLELGRRVMAEVGVKTGLIDVNKAVKHARHLSSQTALHMDSKSKFDPHGFIEHANAKSLASYYMTIGTTAVSAKAKEFQKDSYRKLKLNIAGIADRGDNEVKLTTAVVEGAKRGAKTIYGYALGSLDDMARQ